MAVVVGSDGAVVDELVGKPLVVPLAVVVLDILRACPPNLRLTELSTVVATLRLD
jgi:hypothetical protein